MGGVDALLIAVAIQKPGQAYWAALCAVVGSLAGSLVLFGIARKGGEVLLARHISRGRGKQLHEWFQRYGLVTVFVPALSPIPLPMKVPVFCAGALGVSPAFFVVVLLAARLIRYFGLAFLGLHYGQQSFQFLKTHIVQTVGFAVLLALLAIIFLQIAERRELGRSKAAILND